MKKNNSTTNIFNIGITVITVIIFISYIISNLNNDTSTETTNTVKVSNDVSTKSTEKNVRQMDLEKLEKMGERDRMEYYFSYFIDLVENKSYEVAYEMLYPEFKKKYFDTLSKFTEYAKTTFPKMAHLDYTNIQRNGDVYVLWVEMYDAINGTRNDKKELNVVIKENDFADIQMSFSVI